MHSSNPDPRVDRPAPAFDRILLPRTLPVEIDWAKWLRGIERKRRSVSRQPGTALPAWFNRRATIASFHLEGLEASEADLDDAQVPPHGRRAFRSRPRQRLRNHLAILLSVERAAFKRESLKMEQVLRWYTVISSGLSTSELGLPNMMRIESIVRRINSPQMRLQPAIQEIAKLHCDLLNDPLFPSFNGILTRLLLQVHLTHCGLPPVLFEPHNNTLKQGDAALLLPRLLEMIDQTFDHLAASPSPEPA